jgi:hypothetical protein
VTCVEPLNKCFSLNSVMKFRGKMVETTCMRQFASKFDSESVLYYALYGHNL